MGLAKKLAPVSKSGESIANVDFQWSTQSYTLKEIISKFKLPCVVQCSADSCSVLWAKFHFDLKQPLLLYTVRTVNKIYARTVRQNKSETEYIEFGPPLVIPEDYEGWFGVVSTDSSTLRRHTKVEEVAEGESDYFMAATKVPVYYLNGGESTGVYSQHYVHPGQVLRKDGFINGPLDASSQSNFAAKDKHHLKCIDNKEEEFVIPFSHRGLFYDVSQQIDNTTTGVFNTTQIMDTGGSIFPLTVRHIQGDLPALNYSFTGTLQCNHIYSEQTILACSIGTKQNAPIPLELECKSKIKFSIALNEVDFKATTEYQRSFDFCKNRSEQYAKSIKVSFTLKPEMSTLEELDFSLYDTGSDIEDVDAQSEFDIDWGPDNGNSKETLETLIKSKKNETSQLSSLNVPVESSYGVDMGSSFELENMPENNSYKKAAAYSASLESQDSTAEDVTVDSSFVDETSMCDTVDLDKIIFKQAAEYTASLESHGSTVNDVTVDSSLFDCSYLDSVEPPFDNSDVTATQIPDNTMDTDDILTDLTFDSNDNTPHVTKIPVKRLEYIGNLSKALPGRLLKDEATRTSSGVEADGSTNKLTDDWGPAIPLITLPTTETALVNGHDTPAKNGPISIDAVKKIADDTDSETEINGFAEHVNLSLIDLDSSVESDDDNKQCVIDKDKDLSGRLTSYRSIGFLNKIGPNGEINEDAEGLSNDCNSNPSYDDVISLNASFTGDDSSFGFNPSSSEKDDNSIVSDSEFIISNGYIAENQNKSDSSDFLDDVRDELDLDWDKNSDDSIESVIRRKPIIKLRPRFNYKPPTERVMDMSLEEAAV